ncbi:ankyrin repeat-containing domain protein [Diplogelasinospora grovesii]|uniref:Ankyrin repeat-containing domain protein n=1 Tax=Diplogelasinospora grovesii TaxID=303347 RepID=A0AAN6MZN0_9PEZI|nr:ankyrin repeat-containing domain protein [Diplogelasinospora grovesii]
MDPLSLAASVIAVAGLAATICSAISELRTLCKGLPGRLHAVSNEVVDLELVLTQVATLLKERAILLGSQQSVGAIPHLLIQARNKLNELRAIVDRLTAASANSKLPLLGASIWRKEQGRLQTLQEDIRTVKSSLNILLGASNSQDMMRIRLDIQEISAITIQSSTQSTQEHLALGRALLNTMAKIDDRVARVEELVQAQSQQLHARQFSQVGSSYNAPMRPKTALSLSKHEEAATPARAQDSIGVRVRPYVATCHPGCPCSCHAPQRSATPAILNNILGRLFVGYSGLPVLSPKCDDEECRGARTKQVSMEYWFPISIWPTIVRIQLALSINGGPSLHLETLRRVPDASQCVGFAQNGNIRGLQHLFRHGLASPRDVSSGRGYTLLRWALYAKQYETVEFLVHAGADPDYRPIAASDNNARNKACHFLLEGGLSETATKALRAITNGSDYLDDFIDSSKFTKTHKIVLGLSLRDLEEELLLNPGDINMQDSMGRTPLAWAAARGDAQAVATLLSYGADPNITDVQISGPLSNAAAQGHTACVELLLEAGADPDPALPKGVKKGSPLSVASRNSKDATLLKRLLDFGANVNTLTAEDKTPLFHATRNDNASFAILLLEYGADINATATTGETPLTTAITYNSHNVLRLFLDRWSEYTVCPRLKGPNLLGIAALYGDCETLAILAGADHFRSRHDQHYTLADFKALLRQRVDVTEGLINAFDELLHVVNMAPNPKKSEEGLLESGCFACLSSHFNSPGDGFVRRDTESDEESYESFQDAVEKLEAVVA